MRFALRVVGIVLGVLGGLVFVAGVVEYVRVQRVEEHCPPHATCDGKGLLSFVAMVFGAGGLATAAVGGALAAWMATRRGCRWRGAGGCYAPAVTDDQARRDLMAILDDAKTFEELAAGITAAYGAKDTHPVFGAALRFVAERDAGGLDGALQERFAQVLSVMVESHEALALAAVLEGRGEQG